MGEGSQQCNYDELENRNCFPFDTTVNDLEKLMEGECPANTDKNNEWAYKNFTSWHAARNQQFPDMHSAQMMFLIQKK